MTDLLRERREKIDELDARLAALLAERLALAGSLAGLKKKVRDPRREAFVLRRAAASVKARQLRPAVLAIYRELMKQGRLLQTAARRKKK